ncbi:MAG TPA: restriction endonuclease subunit S [Candidatus Merdenecus merdavium]|nr:restriction endonuclease subunit S [Candidatus Merdenecus merdavium]
MKGDKKRIDVLYSFFNAIRGNNTPGVYQSTLAVLKKLLDIHSEMTEDINDEQLYEIMRDIADSFGVANPFPDRNRFVDIYRTLRGFDEVTWTDILEYGDTKGKFRVPEALIDEMERNFVEGFQDVLIPEAEKFSPCLERLVLSHGDSHFTLTSMDPFYYKVLTEMFLGNDMVDIIQTSIYEYEFTSRKFDLILAAPVFGVRDRAEEGSTFICREYDLIATENLSLHLNSEGILSIILPARITFGGGNVKELREFLQSMYCIKEIADLPSGIFENTGVKTYLLTITTGRTDEVTIKRYVADTDNPRKEGLNKLIVQDDTFVLEDELTDMGDWNIDRIFESQDEDWIKFQESGVKKQELGTVASIFRGKAVNKKDPNGNIGVVNISNIGDYEIDYSSLDHLDEEERKVTNYLLMKGDLLIPARGTAIRVAIFEEQGYPCIASSNVIVIRATDESLSTTFLKLFFDSPLGRKMLVTRQQGTTVMNISYKELNNIEIPLPSIEEQKSIADEYIKELEIYKKSIQEADNRWYSTLSKLQDRI